MSFDAYHDSDLFWRLVDQENARLAACAAERAITAATGKTAMEGAQEALATGGARSAHLTAKDRARTYLRRPMSMDAIDARLPFASPRQMPAIAEHHLDVEVRRRRRMTGFGGEVPLVNAKAVRVAARWLRRFGERADALIAAE